MSGIQDTRGILNPHEGFRRFSLERDPPATDLAAWVERYWTVRWDLPSGERFEQEVLPHPSVQLAFQAGRSAVHGVGTERFVAQLEGTGRVIGVKFRPGGFVPFSTLRMVELVDRVLPVGDVFGAAGVALASEVVDEPRRAVAIAQIEQFLRRCEPKADDDIELVASLVAFAQETPSMTRSEALARHAGMSLRSLQRLFERYVGVGPKWVICRARVQEAAERVAAGTAIDWCALALELGYHDQAHLIHAFKAQVGFTPAQYAKRCAAAHDS